MIKSYQLDRLVKFETQKNIGDSGVYLNESELFALTGITAAKYRQAYEKGHVATKAVIASRSPRREWVVPLSAIADIHRYILNARIAEIQKVLENDAAQALKLEQTLKLRRENAIAESELIPINDAAAALARICLSIKTAVLALPDKLLRHFPSKKRRAVRVELSTVVESALVMLSDELENLGEDFMPNKGLTVTAATALDKPLKKKKKVAKRKTKKKRARR